MTHLMLTLGVSTVQHAGGARPWRRPLFTDYLPEPGDVLSLWDRYGEDGSVSAGPLWPVKARHWLANGTCVVALVDMQVDPNEANERRCRRGFARAWHSDQDGDPEPELDRAGWKREVP